MSVSEKRCTHCGLVLPASGFQKNACKSDGLQSWCKQCRYVADRTIYRDKVNAYHKAWEIKHGIVGKIAESHDSSSYLGVYIAERALSKFFDHIERMPYGNPGYDFICGKGFKIDVKSACLRGYKGKNATCWSFTIRKNQVADYFLCLAFNNRVDLEPQHVWLVPSDAAKNLYGLVVPCSNYGLNKWRKFEKPIENVLSCCNTIRSEAI